MDETDQTETPIRLPQRFRRRWRTCLRMVGRSNCWTLDLMFVFRELTYGISFPPSPTQFGVPSFALIPAVIPKGGMRDVSIEPEDTEGEAAADEATGGEAAPVPDVAVGATEVTVMKVLGVPPPALENPPPPPPWCL
jgi:hypothetical protein